MANPIVAKQIYMVPKRSHQYQKIFSYWLNN